MEVLMRYGSKEHKKKWLRPLMDGEIRSAFLMTEPAVASSDATNIETSIKRDGDHYVINGRKWWSSGMGDPRCQVMIGYGQDRSQPAAPSAAIADSGAARCQGRQDREDAAGVRFRRCRTAYAQVLLDNVRVPASNILLGEGRGFEIAQGRLGPGRIHHCMRTIGKAEEALEKMVRRLQSRTAFGRKIIEYSIWEQRIAEARTDIEMNRLLCLKAADMMDKVGNKTAQVEIAMIKAAAPNMALKISTTPSRRSAPPACPTMPGWRGIMLPCARCAWRTVRTRSITAPLPDLNFGSMQTLPLRTKGSPTNGAPARK